MKKVFCGVMFLAGSTKAPFTLTFLTEKMDRYRDYFDQYGDQYKAALSEREAIGSAIGICPVDWFGQYV